jgi:hypothetical protein
MKARNKPGFPWTIKRVHPISAAGRMAKRNQNGSGRDHFDPYRIQFFESLNFHPGPDFTQAGPAGLDLPGSF